VVARGRSGHRFLRGPLPRAETWSFLNPCRRPTRSPMQFLACIVGKRDEIALPSLSGQARHGGLCFPVSCGVASPDARTSRRRRESPLRRAPPSGHLGTRERGKAPHVLKLAPAGIYPHPKWIARRPGALSRRERAIEFTGSRAVRVFFNGSSSRGARGGSQARRTGFRRYPNVFRHWILKSSK